MDGSLLKHYANVRVGINVRCLGRIDMHTMVCMAELQLEELRPDDGGEDQEGASEV